MVISIANQKGGVGKTTTAVNLSASVSVLERRSLVIDLDPQCNTTSGFGISYNGLHGHVYNLLAGKCSLQEAVRQSKVPYLDIIPSHPDLVGAEIELLDMEDRELVLKRILGDLVHRYEFIFIDCPPSLGLLTINALAASDALVVPLQCEYFALEGLALLLKSINVINRRLNPGLHLLGILLTMFDKRNNLSFRVWEEVHKVFNNNVFKTVIPRNVKLSEAPSYGKPVVLYDITSRGAESYLELAAEIIEKTEAS